jgi:predicted nucleic-acid-binding Zn-ribbon protein
LNEQSKNLKKVSCKNKEEALDQINKFISKDCSEGGKHTFYKVEITYGCPKCGSTFSVDKQIIATVDIDRLINGKKT